MSVWDNQREATLRRLWFEGLSASQIADELGCGISRNAVIGKAHRLGLSVRATKPIIAAPVRAPRAPRPIAAPAPVVKPAPAPMTKAIAPAQPPVLPSKPLPPEISIPVSARVSILDLRESSCRWPFGDPGSASFGYCGGNAPIGEGPYCKYHARIAYQPAQDRRRAKVR